VRNRWTKSLPNSPPTRNAIEYYASLFFDVRDALDHRAWVSLMIRGRIRYDEESGL